MYKLVVTYLYDEAADEKQLVRTFETAVEAREFFNQYNDMKQVAFIEIFEIEKWTRERLNAHAQLEEECEKLGCDDSRFNKYSNRR